MIPSSRPLRILAFSLGLCTAGTALSEPPQQLAAHTVVQHFFDYLLEPKTDIGTDTHAQEVWLSINLRKSLKDSTSAVTAARELPEVDGPDPAIPDNSLFLDSWDFPSTCRAFQAGVEKLKARVEVVCQWGAMTNYPGTSRKATVSLSNERGSWRISEIVTHKSKYAPVESSLLQKLKMLKEGSEALTNLSTCSGNTGQIKCKKRVQ